MKKIFIFLIPFFVLFSASFSAQTIWYVTPTGAGTQNGSSWANARSLQNAVANLNSGQTELRLRQGNYLIMSTLRIDWGRKVRLIGGYSGVGTTRNYTLYPTNLNGQNTTQIMYIQEDDCSIDGVNFINGFATGANEGGAGLVLRANFGEIRNSIFRNNISEGGRGAGALYLMHGYNGAVLIDNCTFENNRSNHKVYPMGDNGGGAIHNWSDNVTIRNSVFRNNYAENEGGAIYSWGENFHLENTRFENNITETHGGGIYINYYDVKLKNTQFIGNKADEGGGIFIFGTSLSVENSQFTNNEAQEGGALNSSFGKWDFLNTVFRNNKASEKGGAIYNHRFSEISTINKSEFYDNAAKQGGAIYNFSDEGLKISNALFHKNLASDKGGAIYNYRNIDVANATFVANTNTAFVIPTYANTPSNPNISHIYNSIFYQNTPKTGGFRADIHSENVSADHGEKDIRRNITQSYTAGTANIIGVNPLFINNATNFRLQQTSPAVNYGVNALYNQVSATPAGTSTDLGNQPRLVGSSIDLGAYELQPVVLACPAMTLPTPNATNVPITTNISWNAIANATGYRISIGTTAGGTNIVNNLNVGNVTTYNHPTDLSPGTTYYVRITPYNAVSATANCGEYSFTTANPTVAIPACSTITFPTNNATNVFINPTITWSASSGATGYRIRIGTTAGGNDVLDQNLGNVTSFTLPSNLNYSTNYFVRIIPFNSAGDATGCSEHRFTTQNAPVTVPACSTITFPTNNATNVSINPTITWTASSGATGYRIRIGTTAGGNDVLSQNLGNVTSFTLPSNLNYSTNYFVRIIPFNSAGDATGCSEHRFTTESAPITVPNCSTITFPTNNATNVSINPTITWTASSGATGYRIRIGTTAGGSDVLNQNLGNVTSFTLPSNLNYSTNYFVRIIPFDATGDATGCSEHQFTTQSAPVSVPACSTITFPTNNATNVSINPTITWSASSGATGYRIRIGTTAGGNDILNQNLGNVTSFTLPSNLNYSTNYFVRIIPFNSAGDATGCSEHLFTTQNAPVSVPACSTITFPTNNATNVSINPTITWSASSGATGYRIRIGTTAGGNDVLSQNLGNVTSFTFPSSLNYNTNYFVRIIPFNSAGDATGCVEHRFTTQSAPVTIPTCSTIKFPTNNETNVSINPTITWSASSGATGYRIRIGTTAGGNDVLSQNLGNVTSFTFPSSLNYNTNYFVRIIPFNSAGDATGCVEHRFTTQSAPVTIPTCSTIKFPTNNETNVSINPTITWTASSRATGYRIRIGTTADGSDVLNQNLGNVTSFTLPSTLNYNTNYFVRIIPLNSAGDATGCSEHRFTTENQIIEEFTIPNVFTPNSDGINDVADFSFLLNQTNSKLEIVDRYGALQFEGNQSNQFIWNGASFGKKSPTGTYWYVFSWTNLLGEHEIRQGWILLKTN